ncbi:MAG: hypothetical protein M1826_006535 [Phylliscum demangeonii]|nr:MAG: hypothetical protein M1826_006535 [Phylliscum demangeonii]
MRGGGRLTGAGGILQAEIYELEGKCQQAYLLRFRHAKLVLNDLQHHPDAQSSENRARLAAVERVIPRSLQRMEALKPRITRQHEQYVQQMHDEASRRLPTVRVPEPHHVRRMSVGEPAPMQAYGLPVAQTLAAGENRALAVQLAQKEIKRRETARRATRAAGYPRAEEHERRISGVWEGSRGRGTEDVRFLDDDGDTNGVASRISQARHLLDAPSSAVAEAEGGGSSIDSSRIGQRHERDGHEFSYPAVPKRADRRYEDWRPDPLPPSASLPMPKRGILKAARAPELPPKDPSRVNGRTDVGPARTRTPPPPPSSSQGRRPGPGPEVDSRSFSSGMATPPPPNPRDYEFKASAYLENGTSLRTIFLPPDLRTTFLGIAAANTRAEVETCGILCGTLISNAWFISRLVIPEQESTSDTCEMVNESALFDYCDGEDLIVLGWIHTHPTQSCFMSSRDLHTHGGYQVSLPESIAIVCAPSRSPSWGIFRLTDPPGLKTILNCKQPGLFHPHPDATGGLYTDALRPGHVFEAHGLDFKVVDLRPHPHRSLHG